MIFRTI